MPVKRSNKFGAAEAGRNGAAAGRAATAAAEVGCTAAFAAAAVEVGVRSIAATSIGREQAS